MSNLLAEQIQDWEDHSSIMVVQCEHPAPWQLFVAIPGALYCHREECEYDIIGELTECDLCGTRFMYQDEWARPSELRSVRKVSLSGNDQVEPESVTLVAIFCGTCAESDSHETALETLGSALGKVLEGQRVELASNPRRRIVSTSSAE